MTRRARIASAACTLVEQTTLFVALAKIDHAPDAPEVTGFGTVLNRITARRSLPLTCYGGREIDPPERLSQKTGISNYFASPHSPWQRGINQNTCDLLRQYFPTRTELFGFAQIKLNANT